MNKNFFSILIRFSPILLLVLMLFILGRINKSSEVYLEVETSAVTFSNAEDVTSLIEKLTVDSVLLIGCGLEFRAKHLMDLSNVDVSILAKTARGEVLLRNTRSILFKDLQINKNSEIALEVNHDYIDLKFQPPLDTGDEQFSSYMNGEINPGDSFSFTGQNMQMSGNPELDINGQSIEVVTSPLYGNIRYEASGEARIRLYLQQNVNTLEESLIQDTFVNNVSFISKDMTKRKSLEQSTIQSADVEIMGRDFFGKQFLLKKYNVEKNDFLLLQDNDEYIIDGLSIIAGVIHMKISCNGATDLGPVDVLV